MTVDAEAGYGMEPAELVAALSGMGAAGCNLEDTDHVAGSLRDPVQHAEWLGAFARPPGMRTMDSSSTRASTLPLRRQVRVPRGGAIGVGDRSADASARLHRGGADCVFPILLWEADALRPSFPRLRPCQHPRDPARPLAPELAELGVARVSYGSLLHRNLMEQFSGVLGSLADAPTKGIAG